VVAAGRAAELRTASAPRRYRVVVEPDAGFLREVPGLSVLDVDGPAALVELPEDGDEQVLLRRALAHGPVRELRPVVPTLAQIFREVVR